GWGSFQREMGEDDLGIRHYAPYPLSKFKLWSVKAVRNLEVPAKID
ncbi:hypothetical protein NPIL_656671, partial [Nephila pilipes]